MLSYNNYFIKYKIISYTRKDNYVIKYLIQNAVNDGLLHYFPFRRYKYLDNLKDPGTPMTDVNVTQL